MTEQALETAMRKRESNFDLLRLAAALLVIISHSYALTGRPSPVVWATERDVGTLAVCVFFTISGFLATSSLHRNPGTPYFVGRVLRILPALFVVCVDRSSRRFHLLNTSGRCRPDGLRNALVFDLHFHLAGVFAGHPETDAVNGSLWTLPIETSFYLALPVSLVLGLLRPRWSWLPMNALRITRVWLFDGGMGPLNAGPILFSTSRPIQPSTSESCSSPDHCSGCIGPEFR